MTSATAVDETSPAGTSEPVSFEEKLLGILNFTGDGKAPETVAPTELDADGNGRVSMAEVKDFGDTNRDGFVDGGELRAMMDTDGDGHVSESELNDFLSGDIPEDTRDLRTFYEMDTDQDGEISAAEKADVDGDGTVSEEEQADYQATVDHDNGDLTTRSFWEMDTDENGGVSAFEAADLNGDGELSADESKSFQMANPDMSQADLAEEGILAVGDSDTRTFSEIDLNGDNIITADEVADINGDGDTTDEEKAEFEEVNAAETADTGTRSFDDANTDGADGLTMREFADTNGDGEIGFLESRDFREDNPSVSRQELVDEGILTHGKGDSRTFSEIDLDGNGALSESELQDLNGDGKVAVGEATPYHVGQSAVAADPNYTTHAEQNDDGDDVLTAAEFADSDADGNVSKAEAEAFAEDNPQFTTAELFDLGVTDPGQSDTRSFDDIDDNNDGIIGKYEMSNIDGEVGLTEAEMSAFEIENEINDRDPNARSLEDMDTNNDGVVTRTEFMDLNGDRTVDAEELAHFFGEDPDSDAENLLFLEE